MTFKEYDNKKTELKNSLVDLEKEFLEKNKPCDIGTMIETDSGTKYAKQGIVTGFKIWFQEVVPKAVKLKKDGTAGSQELHIYSDYKILTK